MARIADYSKDTTITGGDKVIGTNQANGDTVNFLVEDLANYMSSISDIDVSVANLKIRLPQIDSNITIGDGSDVDTTISGDLNVNGDLTVNGTISGLSVEESLSVVFNVKNTSGQLLPKGTVVHVDSTQSSQGNIIDVVKADNSSATGMPAIGILNVQLADDGEGEAVVIGRVNDIDTSAFTAGDELYVNTNGGFTNVKPTGTALIQKIAVVIKSHASNGSIEVFGAGRSNDLPNIALNNVWLGNASGVPTPTVHTIENITDVNITNLQDNQILKYNSSTSKWQNEVDAGSSGSGIALTDLSVGTEGTASGDGDVSYNNSTGVFTYTPPDLSSYLTSVSLNDLTDTTIASPANGQVLKYNSTTSRFENQADAGGIALTDLSVGTEASASGDGAIAYNNTTGVFTYTPPDLSSYLTSAVDGTGTADNFPIWSDSDTLTDSILTQDSGATKVQVAGGIDTTGIIQTSTTNANLQIQGNGTGGVEVRGAGGNDGKIQINCSANSHGVTLQSPPHSSGATYTLILPTTSGTSGQVLTSGGSSPSQLTWSTITVAADSITSDKINFIDDSLSAATAGHMLISDGTDFGNVAMSGDAVITSAGIISIEDSSITPDMRADSFFTKIPGDIWQSGDGNWVTDAPYQKFTVDPTAGTSFNLPNLTSSETNPLVVITNGKYGIPYRFQVNVSGGSADIKFAFEVPSVSADYTTYYKNGFGIDEYNDANSVTIPAYIEVIFYKADIDLGGSDLYSTAEVISFNQPSILDNAVTHDKLSNRYTAVQTIATTTSTLDLDTSSYSVFNITGNLQATQTINIQNMKTGQVIDILATGTSTLTLTSDDTSETFNNLGGVTYDGSGDNHIQIICINDTDSAAIYNYTIQTYTSNNQPN